eukprot:NODE_765_length_1887_cov_29.721023_g712_i0.p1 GENE.NODE_765_length_1887_cov_29.721023_g712_i0~~NODE_765_length_1887_cov_29.721023_g712_i0.p1  ORF type:complete len:622 (-),score=144.51 NODE_765_length_1887_cov_29.721023_g712_i0:21-1715(-)
MLKNEDQFRTFYDGKEKLILLDCGPGWQEDPEVAQDTNHARRLCSAGFDISHTLKALGRSVWHEGMQEFAHSAHLIKRLIDEGGLEDYQNRSESVTLNYLTGELETVGVFNEYSTRLQLPTEQGPPERTSNRPDFSADVKAERHTKKQEFMGRADVYERAAQGVVRIYGYHPLTPQGDDNENPIRPETIEAWGTAPGQFRVVPFTGFFVTPTLLMATRNCNYSKEHNTYALKYAFTRRTRATHGFLTPAEDLYPCTPIRGVTQYLVDSIRHIGVEVPEDIIPPENMSTRWNDVMLFEVMPECQSEVYFIPEIAPISEGDYLASITYTDRPSELWMNETFGTDRNAMGRVFVERDLCDHFWKYDLKSVAFGEAREDEKDGIINHMCCLVPSSLGSPMLHQLNHPADGHVFSFSAINCGRSRTDILSSEGAGGASALRRHNCGLTVHNLAFALVYQHYVAPQLVGEDCYKQVKKYLTPYKILTEKERLQACHVKMLKDADEFNEFGMSFYEHQNLRLALYCFREGARMFSIANIPDQTEYDTKLRDALQSNVSSVIMNLRDSGQMA